MILSAAISACRLAPDQGMSSEMRLSLQVTMFNQDPSSLAIYVHELERNGCPRPHYMTRRVCNMTQGGSGYEKSHDP